MYQAKDGALCKTKEERDYINLEVDKLILTDSLNKGLIHVSYLQEQEIPRLKAENTRLIRELQAINEKIKEYVKQQEE